MTQPPTPTPADDSQVEPKFKKWINEVLDERQVKAEAAAEEQAKKDAEAEAAKPKTQYDPMYALRNFLGF